MLTTRRCARGSPLANAAATSGTSRAWWLSPAASVKVRVVSAGTNDAPSSRATSSCDVSCASTGASAAARGVGTRPRPRRTTSGSPSATRSRASALLTADCVTWSLRAARVALPSCRTAWSTRSRFRSRLDRFIGMMVSIIMYEWFE